MTFNWSPLIFQTVSIPEARHHGSSLCRKTDPGSHGGHQGRAVLRPRQSGKTTLARQIADDAIPFFTLDDATVLDTASADPVGFVRSVDRAVVDEICRAPVLVLVIKTTVDADPRPG